MKTQIFSYDFSDYEIRRKLLMEIFCKTTKANRSKKDSQDRKNNLVYDKARGCKIKVRNDNMLFQFIRWFRIQKYLDIES